MAQQVVVYTTRHMLHRNLSSPEHVRNPLADRAPHQRSSAAPTMK